MFRDMILEIFERSWPMILICLVIVSSMKIEYIIKNKEKVVFYKEIIKLGFIIYIMCLFYAVTFQDVSWSTSNFIPFKEMFRYELGTKGFFKNVIGNMILFIPFGFFVSYLLKIKKLFPIFRLTIISSLTIEITQLLIGRVFDVDDVFLNLIGGLIGFYIYFLIDKIKDKLPELFKKTNFYNIIMIIIVIIIILYLIGAIYV